MKDTLRRGSSNALNINYNKLDSLLGLGYAAFPAWYNGNPMNNDGVVCHHSLSVKGTVTNYDEGDTLTH